MNYKKTVASNIKKLRENQKMTQAVVAKHLGITPQAVSAYERGKKTPACLMLIKIADYFNVSIDCLVGRSDR